MILDPFWLIVKVRKQDDYSLLTGISPLKKCKRKSNINSQTTPTSQRHVQAVGLAL